MKLFKLNLIFALVLFGLALTACSNSNQPSNTSSSPSSSSSTESVESPSSHDESTSSDHAMDHNSESQGGQVVEAGDYHLELKTSKKEQGIHLGFYIQKGNNHELVPNAQVTGQIQLPDGSQKQINFAYDEKGKHYMASLPEETTGKYQLKITAEVDGKPINGRFSFEQ